MKEDAAQLLPVEVLAFGPHPDDVELGCGGTLAKLVRQGLKVGIADLTRGEMGSRGSVPERTREAREAAEIIGASFRTNLEIPDAQIDNTPENREKIIALLRRTRPMLVFLPYRYDRHPDHAHASQLISEACFYSGVAKICPALGQPFRPRRLIYYQISYELPACFYVDISEFFETKLKAVRAHRSQFHNPDYPGEETFISSPEYFEAIEFRARSYGWKVGVRYAEPFWVREPLLIDDLLSALKSNKM